MPSFVSTFDCTESVKALCGIPSNPADGIYGRLIIHLCTIWRAKCTLWFCCRGVVDVDTVRSIGAPAASLLAMSQARRKLLQLLKCPIDYALVDGKSLPGVRFPLVAHANYEQAAIKKENMRAARNLRIHTSVF